MEDGSGGRGVDYFKINYFSQDQMCLEILVHVQGVKVGLKEEERKKMIKIKITIRVFFQTTWSCWCVYFDPALIMCLLGLFPLLSDLPFPFLVFSL